MSDVAQFVAAAQKADPALAGTEKEQAAISKAAAETESLSSNLKVNISSALLTSGSEREAHPYHLPCRICPIKSRCLALRSPPPFHGESTSNAF